MVRGYTPKQFVALFDACNSEQKFKGMFASEFRADCRVADGVNAVAAAYKR